MLDTKCARRNRGRPFFTWPRRRTAVPSTSRCSKPRVTTARVIKIPAPQHGISIRLHTVVASGRGSSIGSESAHHRLRHIVCGRQRSYRPLAAPVRRRTTPAGTYEGSWRCMRSEIRSSEVESRRQHARARRHVPSVAALAAASPHVPVIQVQAVQREPKAFRGPQSRVPDDQNSGAAARMGGCQCESHFTPIPEALVCGNIVRLSRIWARPLTLRAMGSERSPIMPGSWGDG